MLFKHLSKGRARLDPLEKAANWLPRAVPVLVFRRDLRRTRISQGHLVRLRQATRDPSNGTSLSKVGAIARVCCFGVLTAALRLLGATALRVSSPARRKAKPRRDTPAAELPCALLEPGSECILYTRLVIRGPILKWNVCYVSTLACLRIAQEPRQGERITFHSTFRML